MTDVPAASQPDPAQMAHLLVELGAAVRARICHEPLDRDTAAQVVGFGGGDTIFGLDRHVEAMMVAAIAAWPQAVLPVALFAEGLPEAPLRIGPLDQPIKSWLLIDPIDGTRGLMYGKRSAYFLAAAAPGHLDAPRLSDSIASVAVELPTLKQAVSDAYFWSLGAPICGTRTRMATGHTEPLTVARPSGATSVDQGFGSVAAFFPEGKSRLASLAEFIAHGAGSNGVCAQVFDDQFMSSGGQMIELLTGRDRFVIDVRPQVSAQDGGQCAHPYDLALTRLLQASGVVLRAPCGGVLDAAYGLDESVAWCGYANEAIACQVHPLVEAWLEHLNPGPQSA